jgi:hypothetical protein
LVAGRRRTLFLSFISLFLVSCEQDNPAQVAGSIINAFSSSCSSAGPWSQAARSDAQALIQIFEELKTKDKCKDLGTILQQMTSAATSIHGLYNQPAFLAYRQKEEELQELTLMLAKTTDADLQKTLSDAIVQLRRDMATARANKTVENSTFGDQFSEDTNNVATQFGTLFNYNSQISECLQQSPSAAISIFSTLASLGGSFASPVLGSQMGAVSSMLNQFLGVMRQAHIDKAIWELYDSQMPQAMTCGLESMTQFYCQAEDTSEIVMRQAGSYPPPPDTTPTNFWKGLDIISRRLPVLNKWLLTARSGLAPQNSSDSRRVREIRAKRSALDLVDVEIVGNLNEAKRLIERTNDDAIKKSTLLQRVANIALGLQGQSPFSEENRTEKQFACLLVREKLTDCSFPSDDDRTTLTFLEELYDSGAFTIDQVINTFWPKLLEQVTRRVLNQFNDIVFIDPTSIIGNAHESSPQNVSSRQVLVMVSQYLIELREQAIKNGKVHRLVLIEDTMNLVTEAIRIVDSPGPYSMKGDDNPLVEIYEIFRLDFGVQFFNDRLSRLVEYDLNDRMANGELPGTIEDILRSSGDEILRRLVAAGVRDLFPVQLDLNAARNQSRENFWVFRKFMFDKLGEAIVSQNQKGLDIGETLADGPYRTYGQSVAQMCMLLYSTSGQSGSQLWPSPAVKRICEDSVLFSVYPDPSNVRRVRVGDIPQYLTQWNDKPLVKNRMKTCMYYNFLRSERLYETLQEKPKDGDDGDEIRRMSVPKQDINLWQKLIFPF